MGKTTGSKINMRPYKYSGGYIKPSKETYSYNLEEAQRARLGYTVSFYIGVYSFAFGFVRP
jgi:hypothetical protein